jgi:hypothetical protein
MTERASETKLAGGDETSNRFGSHDDIKDFELKTDWRKGGIAVLELLTTVRVS